MGNCKLCNKIIDDKYQLCVECNIKAKQSNQSDDLIKILTKINWNLGKTALNMEIIANLLLNDYSKIDKLKETIGKIKDDEKTG